LFKIYNDGAVAKDGRLSIGTRILEVNNRSLLGVTQEEAIDALEHSDSYVHMLVCDGLSTNNFAIMLLNKSSMSTSELNERRVDDRAISGSKSELVLNSNRTTGPESPPARSALSLHDLEKWDSLNSNEEYAPSPIPTDMAMAEALRGSSADRGHRLLEETASTSPKIDRPAIAKKPTVPLKPSFIKKPLYSNANKVQQELDNVLQSRIPSRLQNTVRMHRFCFFTWNRTNVEEIFFGHVILA
uniref:PDZ domain-containing protein n=1 Tax=Soboliphyme baturini TaxID=241478 RepID=A0A183IVX4_9BILA